MNIEALREYALQKPAVTEGFPFGDTSLVFKVKEKIFLLASLDEDPLRFNVKSDPEKAIQLREEFPGAVLPGYHMNKRHWNTIVVNGTISNKQLLDFVDESYLLVSKGRK